MATQANTSKPKHATPSEKKTTVSRGCTYAEQRNWEQRVKTEKESGEKWNETWGDYFSVLSPAEKIEQLEEEVRM